MPVEHKPAFDRVHRTVDSLHAVRQPVVEDDQAIEPRLDRLIKFAARSRPCEMRAKRIDLLPDQGFAADRAAFVSGQRVDEAETAVDRIVVPVLAASADIKAEKGPG